MRLIDADALKTTLGISAEYCDKCRWGDIRGRCSRSGDFEIVCCAIDDAPTIDPVKRGRWVKLDMHPHLADHKCTACGESAYVPTCMGEPMYLFCPNCGAKMKGEEDERSNQP